MRCDQVEQFLLLGFCPLVASLRGHARLPHEPPTGHSRISGHRGNSCDQCLQADLSARRVRPRWSGRNGIQICPHQLSRCPRPAKGTAADWWIKSLVSVRRLWKNRPHIPSYLYMAAKQECVSPSLNFSSASPCGCVPKDIGRHESWIVGFCYGSGRDLGSFRKRGAPWTGRPNC